MTFSVFFLFKLFFPSFRPNGEMQLHAFLFFIMEKRTIPFECIWPFDMDGASLLGIIPKMKIVHRFIHTEENKESAGTGILYYYR